MLDHPHEITADCLDPAARLRRSTAGASRPVGLGVTDPLPSLREARLATEKELVLRALELHRGNASRAAKALQVTRRHLGSLIDKHGIELESIKRERASEPSPPQAGKGRRSEAEGRENASPSRRSPWSER
jgi:DNA-binding NtrC family response regulator